MKKIFTLSIFIVFQVFYSQNNSNKWYLSLGTFATDHTSVRGIFENYYDFKNWSGTPLGKIVLSRYISPSFAGEFQALGGEIDNKRLNYNNKWLSLVTLGVRYKFTNNYILKEGNKFDPYLKIGVGYHSFDYNSLIFTNFTDQQGHYLNDGSKVNRDNFAIAIGAGLNYWFNKKRNVGVNIETQYDWMPRVGNDYIDFFQHSIGLALMWGAPSKIETPEIIVENIPEDTDQDGIINTEDRCVDIKGMISNIDDCNGCPDTDLDGMCDKNDKCPLEFGESIDDYCPKPKGVEVTKKLNDTLKDLLFDTNKSNIKKSEDYKIQKVADIIKENGGKYYIIGYTDSVGNDDFNLKLSKNRANEVVNALIKLGVSKDDLIAEGYGETKPICPENNTDECRQKNRRVEIVPYK